MSQSVGAQLAPVLISAGGIVLAAFIVFVVSRLWKLLHVSNQLKDAILGEPATPFAEARPGVIERTTRVEHHVTLVETKLEDGLNEAKNRIESGLKDTRDRVDGQFKGVGDQIQHLSEQMHEIKGAVTKLRNGNGHTERETIVLPPHKPPGEIGPRPA